MRKIVIFLILSLFVFAPAMAEVDEDSTKDLKVSSVLLYPAYPSVEQEAKIVVKVTNNGTTSFKTGEGINSKIEDFEDFVIESSIYPSISYEEPLEVGSFLEFVYFGRFKTSGAKTLVFTVDASDTIDEKNEVNNTTSKSVTVYEDTDADITIKSMSFDIEKPLIQEEVEISIAMKNSGKRSLTDNKGFMFYSSAGVPSIERDIEYFFDDFEIDEITMDAYPEMESALNPGQVFKWFIKGRFTKSGKKDILYKLNKNNRLLESDVDNNLSSTSIQVYNNIADRDAFRVSNLVYEFLSSESVEFSWETSESITTTFSYRQSITTKYETITSSNKTSHIAKLTKLAPGGTYFYKVSATVNDEIKEISENSLVMPKNDNLLIDDYYLSLEGNRLKAIFTSNLRADTILYYRREGEQNYESVSGEKQGDIYVVETDGLANGVYSVYLYAESSVDTNFSTDSQAIEVSGSFDMEEESPKEELPTETNNSSSENQAENTSSETIEVEAITITNGSMYENLKGKIILRVEKNGEAYYVSPDKKEMYFLGRPDDAFLVMREKGIGISNANLEKIAISLAIKSSGPDSDGDGLSDILEDAISTNKYKSDSDGDGFSDLSEVSNSYDPTSAGGKRYSLDSSFSLSNQGNIFIQVERNGEAWYVNPGDKMRYFLGRPVDAFSVMRELGLGISEEGFGAL